MLQVIAYLLYVIFLFGKGDCLVFLQGTASVKLPHDFPVGVTFYRLQALDEETGELQNDHIEFRIIKSVIFPNGVKSGRWLFSVDEHTGSLMLAPHRRHSIAEHIGSTFALDVVAVPSSSPLEKPAHATIVVSVTEDNSTEPACQPREELCFASPEVQFQLPETLPKGSLLGSLKPIPYTKLCPDAVTRYSILSKTILGISSKSGTLALKSSLDYEEAISHVWNVSCKVESDGETSTFYAKVHVFVIDIDDNPPYLQNSTATVQEIDASTITPGKAMPLQLTVLDPDSASVNDIAVTINDPLKLFYVRDPVVFHGVNGTHMLINAALVPKYGFRFPGSSYNVTVTFNDTKLINHDGDSFIEFLVIIHNRSNVLPKPATAPDDFQVVATIFRHSTHHARVVQPMEVQSHEGYFFRLLGERGKGLISYRIFGVTPITGIIYVADEVSLSRSTVSLYRLVLTWRSREAADRQCVVLIRVIDTGDQRSVCGLETGHHFPTCASHGNAKSCVSSCGRGSVDGYCKWRQASSRNLVSQYATCSPHLKTCPDGVCDELEMLDPFLCPQDCVENVRGAAIPNDSGKGIGKAAAPCTCPTLNTCNCVHFYPAHVEKKLNMIVKTINPIIPHDAHSVRTYPVGNRANFSECDGGCQLMIGFVSLVVSMLVSVAGFHLYSRYKKKSKCDEFPTITTPLYPSTQSNGSCLQDSCQQFQNALGNRLEFPRDKLILEDILGEGEFGKVVKGQARGIGGNPELTTVAVKMLKDGSSATEKRDLISELNLLKEIHHPNVIRLLGACTDEDGPLYLIMEYAEHGALLTYLRKTRARYPEVQLDLDELLSFALQIAKGMDYLASMKVVHRDLAARNILVATGKVLKISDFGLSRDIYEGDKYHKSSKSRVPVKWMALESLQNNLYTTKSDVWSYGILLWEIMTVGGSPYPGIAAEKLYQMLKDGYRMPKPDDCPNYVYKIMKSCWREKPNERPSFKELVQRIETIQFDLRAKDSAPVNEDEHVGFIMTRKNKSENGCKMQQLTSFPKMSIVQIAPYEKQCLLSPTEFSV